MRLDYIEAARHKGHDLRIEADDGIVFLECKTCGATVVVRLAGVRMNASEWHGEGWYGRYPEEFNLNWLGHIDSFDFRTAKDAMIYRQYEEYRWVYADEWPFNVKRYAPGTHVISEDCTYPGIVVNSDPLESQPQAVYVKWFKWGWEKETFETWEFLIPRSGYFFGICPPHIYRTLDI